MAKRRKTTSASAAVEDRQLAESFADSKRGRVYGPFREAGQAIASMKQELRNRQPKQKS